MTRLLKIPIVGPCDAPVASSSIDMLGGLSKSYILRMPPAFCANAASPAAAASSNAAAAASPRRCPPIFCSSPFQRAFLAPTTARLARQRSRGAAAPPGARHSSCVLSVEPAILHAPAVEEAVHQERRPLYVRVPAGRATVVKDDWSGAFLRQLPFDRPHQLLALSLVGLGRLPLSQLVDLRAAVAVKVQLAAAPVQLVEDLIGVRPAL